MSKTEIKLTLPKSLRKALTKEAGDAQISIEALALKKLENITPPVEYIDRGKIEKNFDDLISFLELVPGLSIISKEVTPESYWWVKLNINVNHPLAWRVVQELGFVLNYLSVQEKLPTVFMPVSPPPYLNGGIEFLAWVIESKYSYVDPAWIEDVLKNRLPQPVQNEKEWEIAA